MSETYRIPPYLHSEDPEVIATVERNNVAYQAFAEACWEFARKYGVKPPQSWRSEPHPLIGGFGGKSLTGITGDKPVAGQWKSTKSGWAPFAKNPIHSEMTAIRCVFEPTPGLPSMVTADGSREGILWVRPVPFISQGAAWVMLSHPGTSDEPLGEQWSEVLGSMAMAAREALSAARADS